MTRLPAISNKHKVCIICEGYEEYHYINKLLDLNVWNSIYEFTPINAKSASKIFPKYQDAYNNARYEIILVFCDTDKPPYREYNLIKQKINDFHGKRNASNKITIFANPCTMQIILLHFDEVFLSTQAKKTNAPIIFDLTGVENYDAKDEQIKQLCSKIFKRTYSDMKKRVDNINGVDTKCGSTNFGEFLDNFENEDVKWIKEINKYLEE